VCDEEFDVVAAVGPDQPRQPAPRAVVGAGAVAVLDTRRARSLVTPTYGAPRYRLAMI
jgi:hypothetical protein